MRKTNELPEVECILCKKKQMYILVCGGLCMGCRLKLMNNILKEHGVI